MGEEESLENKAEDFLAALLIGWKSRYRHTIELLRVDESLKQVKFITEWSRRPTPNEPVPDVRATAEFTLKYSKRNPGASPAVSYRFEKEHFVHT